MTICNKNHSSNMTNLPVMSITNVDRNSFLCSAESTRAAGTATGKKEEKMNIAISSSTRKFEIVVEYKRKKTYCLMHDI